MDKIKHCINHNRFIPIDTEELSALELIGKGTEKTNELVDKSNEHEERITNNENKKVSFDDMKEKYKFNNETDIDYRGKWFGLDEPTLSDEGMRSQVQKNRDDIIKANEQMDNIIQIDIPNIENKIELIKTINEINVHDFGAKGDGVTDDYQAITNAIEYCRLNKKVLRLCGKHLTKRTLDFSGLIGVVGSGSSYPNVMFDETYYNGEMIREKWFVGERPPYSRFVEGVSGTCIVSNIANPIVKCENGELRMDSIGIYGWFDFVGQIGFSDIESQDKYTGTIKEMNNVKIAYCGGHGMRLRRGIECTEISNSRFCDNGGHGLLIDNIYTYNPCEYTKFTNCFFENNFLDGCWLYGHHRNIDFDTCNFSRNGQYQMSSTSGRDRTFPTDFGFVKTGVRASTRNGINGSSISLNNCYGEMCQNMLYIQSFDGTFNGVKMSNCTQMPMAHSDQERALPKSLICINGNYTSDISMVNNFGVGDTHAIYNFNSDTLFAVDVQSGTNKTTGVNVNSMKNVIEISKGSHDAWNKIIKTESYFKYDVSELEGIVPLILLLNTNWQAKNSILHGTYLITVQRGFNGKYAMALLKLNGSEDDGHIVPPFIDVNTGDITLSLKDSVAYSLSRINNFNS